MLFLFEEIFCQKRQQLLQRWFDLTVIANLLMVQSMYVQF